MSTATAVLEDYDSENILRLLGGAARPNAGQFRRLLEARGIESRHISFGRSGHLAPRMGSWKV